MRGRRTSEERAPRGARGGISLSRTAYSGRVGGCAVQVRLFCEQSASGVCVEGDYLELQARNAAKGRAPPMFPVGKY